MTKQERVAYINSQVACALIVMEGMKAENTYREMRGETIAYGDKAFNAVIDQHGIGHNAVMACLGGDS